MAVPVKAVQDTMASVSVKEETTGVEGASGTYLICAPMVLISETIEDP